MIDWKVLLVCVTTFACSGPPFKSGSIASDDAGTDAQVESDASTFEDTLPAATGGSANTNTGGASSIDTISTSTLSCKCDCSVERAQGIECNPCSSVSQCQTTGTGGRPSTGGAPSTGGTNSISTGGSSGENLVPCLNDLGIQVLPNGTQACYCSADQLGTQTCFNGAWTACECPLQQNTGGASSVGTSTGGATSISGTGGTTSTNTAATGGLNGGTYTSTVSPIREIVLEIPGIQTAASPTTVWVYSPVVMQSQCYPGQVFDPWNGYALVQGWSCKVQIDRSKTTELQVQLGPFAAAKYICSGDCSDPDNRFMSSDFSILAYDDGSPVAVLAGAIPTGWKVQMSLQFTPDKSTVHVILPPTWPAPVN